MNTDKHLSIVKVRIIGFFLVFLVCVCASTLPSGKNLFDLINRIQRSNDIATAEAYFDQIVRQIAVTTEDTLLETSRTDPLELSSLHSGCIQGLIEQIYGSAMEFRDVITNYSQKFFVELGWQQNFSGHVYQTQSANIILDQVDFSAIPRPSEWMNFRTVYRVALFYAAPSVTDRQG